MKTERHPDKKASNNGHGYEPTRDGKNDSSSSMGQAEGIKSNDAYGTVNREYTWGENSEPVQRKTQKRKTRSSNRGKGPKGFERSDIRLKEQVSDILSDDPELDASGIEVVVLKGEVTLSGIVESKADKRRAADLLKSVSGVAHVENQLAISK